MSYAWLPEVLAEIADVAGLDAALEIAAKFGGTEVYIPARAAEGHWLVRTVGRAAADKLCKHFAFTDSEVARHGTSIMLPLGPRGAQAEIRATVDRMIADGRPNGEIALAAGYTVRGVEKRKAKLRGRADDVNQLRLFPVEDGAEPMPSAGRTKQRQER